MKIYLSVAVISLVFFSVNAKHGPPHVQVYTHIPGDYGVPNTLICHVTDFYPPDIVITLWEDGREMTDAKQTDLAFENGWQFYLTKSVPFTPVKGKTYSCKVKHMDNTREHHWSEAKKNIHVSERTLTCNSGIRQQWVGTVVHQKQLAYTYQFITCETFD